MLKRLAIGSVVMVMTGCAGAGAPTGPAAISQAALPTGHYVVFFDPDASQLDAEGQAIVREAVAGIEDRRPSKIEIMVPAKAPGGDEMIQDRYATIQNIMLASGMDAAMDTRVVLASDGINLPGANDRAEIRLIP